FRRINHEDALSRVGIFLVEHDDAGGDAGAVEKIRREADDALDVAATDDLAPDVSFGAAAKQYAVWQIHGCFGGALEAREDVERKRVVAVLGRRHAELEALEFVFLRVEPIAPR